MADNARDPQRATGVKVLEPAVVASELTALARTLTLQFPIVSKEQFVEQLVASAGTIRFNGSEYDTEFAAGLIPAFFFPIADLDDLLHKSTELLLSRGLISGHG